MALADDNTRLVAENTELLHQARRTLQSSIDDIKREAQSSRILHGDETS